jgi:hypothetical protein
MHHKWKLTGVDYVNWFVNRCAIYGGFWVRVLKWTSRNCQPYALWLGIAAVECVAVHAVVCGSAAVCDCLAVRQCAAVRGSAHTYK